MARSDKLLALMARNPAGDWRIEDFETLAARFGCIVRRAGGSHVVIRSPAGVMITVPARRPIKPIYVRKFVEFFGGRRCQGKK